MYYHTICIAKSIKASRKSKEPSVEIITPDLQPRIIISGDVEKSDDTNNNIEDNVLVTSTKESSNTNVLRSIEKVSGAVLITLLIEYYIILI